MAMIRQGATPANSLFSAAVGSFYHQQRPSAAANAGEQPRRQQLAASAAILFERFVLLLHQIFVFGVVFSFGRESHMMLNTLVAGMFFTRWLTVWVDRKIISDDPTTVRSQIGPHYNLLSRFAVSDVPCRKETDLAAGLVLLVALFSGVMTSSEPTPLRAGSGKLLQCLEFARVFATTLLLKFTMIVIFQEAPNSSVLRSIGGTKSPLGWLGQNLGVILSAMLLSSSKHVGIAASFFPAAAHHMNIFLHILQWAIAMYGFYQWQFCPPTPSIYEPPRSPLVSSSTSSKRDFSSTTSPKLSGSFVFHSRRRSIGDDEELPQQLASVLQAVEGKGRTVSLERVSFLAAIQSQWYWAVVPVAAWFPGTRAAVVTAYCVLHASVFVEARLAACEKIQVETAPAFRA